MSEQALVDASETDLFCKAFAAAKAYVNGGSKPENTYRKRDEKQESFSFLEHSVIENVLKGKSSFKFEQANSVKHAELLEFAKKRKLDMVELGGARWEVKLE